MAMTDLATNPQRLHIKISRYLPIELKRALHPAAMDDLCRQAFDNGWRDAEWLAGYAMEGTSHPSVENAAAVFVHRLREAIAEQCPENVTPQPAAFTEAWGAMNKGNEPTQEPSTWADRIRKQLRGRTT